VTHHATQEIGVGMLGYAFMGRAHAQAYRAVQSLPTPPPLRPRLISIAGRSPSALEAAAAREGYESYTTDWHDLVGDPRIGLFDNGGPNHLHAEPTIAAARNGKHVICEKPLGRTASESLEIWQEVEATGVKHMCGFNYRFVPAVRMARDMVAAGELGEIRHFRGTYLQDWGEDADLDGWRFDSDQAGTGALGDLASHVVDLAHFLVGEITSVAATARTFVADRQVDDSVAAVVEFAAGTTGTIEATRLAPGRRNSLRWELNGSRGSLAFDLERLNELQIYRGDGDAPGGFATVLVTGPHVPYGSWWWPPGHVIGWEHTFVHEIHHLLYAIAEDQDVAPYGATFEDGYRAAEVCDAMLRSAGSGRREAVSYVQRIAFGSGGEPVPPSEATAVRQP
jgi:predicted dehydrogenase